MASFKPIPQDQISNTILSGNQVLSDPTAKDRKKSFIQKHKTVNRAVVLILIITALFVLVPMLNIFLTPILLACTFASLLFPFYTFLLKFFRQNRAAASAACCAILVLGFAIPIYFIGYLVVHQLLALYQQVYPAVQAFVKGNNTGFLDHFANNLILSWLTAHNIDWQNTMLNMIKTIGAALAKTANKTSLGVIEVLAGFIVTLFIMFYFFIDGPAIVTKFRQLLPLKTTYQDMIINRFLLVSRATVKGTLIIAFIQGSLGSVILLIFGIKTWLLWGVVMITLALVPMLGAWPILIPAGIIRMAMGHPWQGIVILALSFGVISTIDNILRPQLVGRGSHMHDLLIFFSSIGGLTMFGPVGVIAGPVIMAFFVSIIEIYTVEFKEHLGGPDEGNY